MTYVSETTKTSDSASRFTFGSADVLDATDTEGRTYYRIAVTPQVVPIRVQARASRVWRIEDDGSKTRIDDGHFFDLSWASRPDAKAPTLVDETRLGLLERYRSGQMRLNLFDDPQYTRFNGWFRAGHYELQIQLVTLDRAGAPNHVEGKRVQFRWDGLTDPEIAEVREV